MTSILSSENRRISRRWNPLISVGHGRAARVSRVGSDVPRRALRKDAARQGRPRPWLAEVDVLHYTLIYRGGGKLTEFAGGGIGRLQARLERLRAEAGG